MERILLGVGVLLLAETGSASDKVTLSLPLGTSVSDVVLAASRSVQIGDRAIVRGPASRVGTVVNVGSDASRVGVNAKVQTNVTNVGPFQLANFSTLQANFTSTAAPEMQAGALILGQSSVVPQLTLTSVTWDAPDLTSDLDVYVYQNQSQFLSADAFDEVTVLSGGTLTVGPGTYDLRKLQLEANGTLNLNVLSGPAILYVEEEIALRGRVVLNGPASNVAVVYKGSNWLTVETPFSGTIVAPNAPLRLAASGTKKFSGQFFGASVVPEHVS